MVAGADPGFRGGPGLGGKVRGGQSMARGVQIGGGEGCAPPARSATISILKNAQNNHIYSNLGL